MKKPFLTSFAFFFSLLLGAWPVMAQLPAHDLTVESRQVEGAGSTSYAVSTRSASPRFTAQQVKVRNGEKATLSVGLSMPMQWVQAVAAQGAALAVSGASASSSAGKVNQAVMWMDSGHTIKVHPRWLGGSKPVIVEIEVVIVDVGVRTGADLPDQSRSQVVTTVSAFLGQWVTIAASGNAPQRGVYGSDAVDDSRRELQIRVLAP